MGPSENIKGGFKFMILRSMKDITGRSWDMITMPDTVINKFNILGKYQQELLGFTDCTGRLIGYGDFEFTGADGEGGENEVPLKIKS